MGPKGPRRWYKTAPDVPLPQVKNTSVPANGSEGENSQCLADSSLYSGLSAGAEVAHLRKCHVWAASGMILRAALAPRMGRVLPRGGLGEARSSGHASVLLVLLEGARRPALAAAQDLVGLHLDGRGLRGGRAGPGGKQLM